MAKRVIFKWEKKLKREKEKQRAKKKAEMKKEKARERKKEKKARSKEKVNIKKDLTEYALYKGEELLSIGTLEELAEFKGCKINTMKFYLSPSWKKRSKNSDNRLVLIRLE